MPKEKIVQIELGTAVIESIVSFSRADLLPVSDIANVMCHISNAELRQTIAEAVYGARWIYKLGLVLLVKDDELLAHARAQIMEYGAACEAILSDMLNQHKSTIVNDTFYNKINMCHGARIINYSLKSRLHNLRKWRNEAHMVIRNVYRFIESSKQSFDILRDTVSATRAWKGLPPAILK